MFDSPFVYMVAPGLIVLSDQEVNSLRRYLNNGGFLMMDDFWGSYHKANILKEMKRVLPDVEPRELPLGARIPAVGDAVVGEAAGA